MGTVIPHYISNQFQNNKLIDAINPGMFLWLNKVNVPTTAPKAQIVMQTQNVTSSTVSHTQDKLDNR